MQSEIDSLLKQFHEIQSFLKSKECELNKKLGASCGYYKTLKSEAHYLKEKILSLESLGDSQWG